MMLKNKYTKSLAPKDRPQSKVNLSASNKHESKSFGSDAVFLTWLDSKK